MLSLAEDVLLLALDPETGKFKTPSESTLHYGIPGALLLQLALSKHIDTDLEVLHVVATEATQDPLLDEVLACLVASPKPRETGFWIRELPRIIPDMRQRIVAGLLEKGVLHVEEGGRVLRFLRKPRYTLQDAREITEVRQKLRQLVDSDELPDAEEAVLIALVDACQLFGEVFAPEELQRLQPRISMLAQLELIGREVSLALQEIARAVAVSMDLAAKFEFDSPAARQID